MKKKLIEVSMPLEAINAAAGREKSIRHGHPSTLHLWWARRPLAAARAVLFGQLVDDPSSWPEIWKTEAAQVDERKRLHGLIEQLVIWENSHNEGVLNAARLEIARSHARNHPSKKSEAVLADGVSPKVVNEYLATEVPPLHDPFAGGGTIPLEAQRLGLRAIASDLNPVAVLINKALIEIPPRFAGLAPVNPDARAKKEVLERQWRGAQGLAEDLRYYGKWMRGEAFKRIGNLYPDVEIEKGKKATVIAWLWARTVASPDPAFRGEHVPLVSSFWLSTKLGKEAWVEPVVEGKKWRFEVRTGKLPKNTTAMDAGTKLGRGANFSDVLSKERAPIEPSYIKAEGAAGRMSARLMAIVAEGDRRRVYASPTPAHEKAAVVSPPAWVPDQEMPKNPRWFSPPDYGMPEYRQIFTNRQLVALTTFSDLVKEARERARADAAQAGLADDGVRLRDGGSGADAYADAMATYLSFALSKTVDGSSTICRWMVQRDSLFSTFSRQALPMTWDFAEVNVLADCTRSLSESMAWTAESIDALTVVGRPGTASMMDAKSALADGSLVSTDPPYFDNIGYADLSDFFYVWLRPALREVFPRLFETMVVPKAEELIASPYRHGGHNQAQAFFMSGMRQVLSKIAASTPSDMPATIYYAYKQADSDGGTENRGSTGWEAFLESVHSAGLVITSTIPLRTERESRSISLDTNSLASSIVLTVRRRPDSATATSRPEFRRELKAELPTALRPLLNAGLAPVDLEQAVVGPGMEIFTRHTKVLEGDGQPMSVATAIALIHEALDEFLNEDVVSMDPESLFALRWFEAHQFDQGTFGDAETLAKARGVPVKRVEDAGIAKQAAGKVRLLKRSELPEDYDPRQDSRPTVWEACQHLIKRLESSGEDSAAELLARLGESGARARDLAYRLYNICDRKRWSEEARGYNQLVTVWADLERLAQARKGEVSAPSPVPPKRKKPKKSDSKQGELL